MQGRKKIEKIFITLNIWMHSVHVKFEPIIDDCLLKPVRGQWALQLGIN